MTRARRRALGIGAAAGLALGLTACNPLSIEAKLYPDFFSESPFVYSGPAGAWFEVAVTGADGYRVETETTMWLEENSHPPVVKTPAWDCGSATVRRQRVDCYMNYAEFPHTFENHRADLDAPGTYWPTILLRSPADVRVHVYCFQGGAKVDCPASTTVGGRTTDDAGNLVGDLKRATPG